MSFPPDYTPGVSNEVTDSGSDMNSGLLITIVVCSLAGVCLLVLVTILIILLVMTKKARDRKEVRNYSVAGHCQTTRERVEMMELSTNSGVVLVNSADAPQLPQHAAAVIQELRASFSMQQQNLKPPKLAANIRERSTSSHSGAMNSTSTNTTVVVDMEDSGAIDEPVFLENETKSNELAKPGCLLYQPSGNCVSTRGRGSHECTKTTTAGKSPIQKTTDSCTGNGFLNKHGINHRDPETGSPSYVNNIIRQASDSVHTNEQRSAMQYSLSQPLLTECNQSPTYMNHTEIPFCRCRVCCTSDYSSCGYVNVPNQSSLSQPLLDDNCDLHHVPLYVNQTQAHSSSELDNGTRLTSLSPFSHQTSEPTNEVQANEQASSSHRVHSDGNDLVHGYVNIVNRDSEMIPPPEQKKSLNDHPGQPASSKSPNLLRSLPPRAQQPTTGHCESPQLTSTAQRRSDSGYEDASSLQQTISTITQRETAPCVGRSQSNKSSSAVTSDHGYVNITKPRSISQPTPVTADMLNSSLIPPRTILRADFCQPSKSNNIRALPPRTRSKTETIPPPLTLLPAEDLQLVKSTEIVTKSFSGCSSGSLVHPDATIQAEKRCVHEKSKKSETHRNSCRDRGCSCEPVGDDSYVVDEIDSFDSGKKMTDLESAESLDLWPPVIPPQTELIFIVADKPKPASVDREDFGVGCVQDGLTDSVTKNIKMTRNASYVKHNNY